LGSDTMVGSAFLIGIAFGPVQVLIKWPDKETRLVQVNSQALDNALGEFATEH